MSEKQNVVIRSLKRLRTVANHFKDKVFLDWALNQIDRLRQFEDIHQGESCFIIGNGPSITDMDLAPLKDCICFGLNKIYMHPEVERFGIDYHVAVNPLVIEQSFDEFKTLGCPSFLSFRPSQGQKLDESNYFYIMAGDTHKFCEHPYEPISEGCTVTYVAMELAYFMGFSTVYLIGVDHSFSVQGDPHETQVMEGPDSNHFHPDYFSGKKWQLPDIEGSELAYLLARYYYKRAGRQILDATEGGKLEIFPKIDFQDAVSRCRRTPASRSGAVNDGY